jgi:hypothetical protein
MQELSYLKFLFLSFVSKFYKYVTQIKYCAYEQLVYSSNEMVVYEMPLPAYFSNQALSASYRD